MARRWLAYLLLAGLLGYSTSGDTATKERSFAEELNSMTSEVVQEHSALLAQDADVSNRLLTSEPKIPCSRNGFLRTLHEIEARFLKPWELCSDCGGDLTGMFDIRCFEPDGIAQTTTLAQMDPSMIRKLMARAAVREQIDAKERWGESPAAVCFVGCKAGFRTASTIGESYLVYECQNITVQEDAPSEPNSVPLYSDSWLPPRTAPPAFSPEEQVLIQALQNGDRQTLQKHINIHAGATMAQPPPLPSQEVAVASAEEGSRRKRGRKKAKKKHKMRQVTGTGLDLVSSFAKVLDTLTVWRCISPGENLQRANLLHGGMPCEQEQLAVKMGCQRPFFDIGFQNLTFVDLQRRDQQRRQAKADDAERRRKIGANADDGGPRSRSEALQENPVFANSDVPGSSSGLN